MQSLLEFVSVDLEQSSNKENESQIEMSSLDGSLLIDVICQTLSDSCKHFCQAGIVALRFINILVKALFDGDDNQLLNQAYELPFFQLLLERVNQLCYRRDWYVSNVYCIFHVFLKNNEIFIRRILCWDFF